MIGERLREARKRAGLAQVELAAAMGDRYNGQMISMVENNHSGLLMDGAVKAARELGVSLDYLVGLTDDPTPSAQLSDAARISSNSGASTPATAEPQIHGYAHTFRSVAVLEVASAAGSGAEVYDETPVGVMWFREDWLNDNNITPAQCNVISVSGDSMEPTLPDGCSILVDRSRIELQDGRIYVMRNEDGLIVKRVEHRPQYGWLLISDNILWRTIPMSEATDIIGEVLWSVVTY